MFKRIGDVIKQWFISGVFFKKIIFLIYKTILFIVNKLFAIVKKIIVKILFILRNLLCLIFYLPDWGIKTLARKRLAKKTPVENKVLFLTFQGGYTCNPRAIADEMIRQNVDAKLVWDVKTKIPACDYPMQLRMVKHDTVEFYKELASAKVIIENTNIMERIGAYKNKDQYLIQTWHGSMGIKRLDGDVVMGRAWKRLSKKCQKYVDYLLSNSDFETEVFQTAYWPGVEILNTGHARNDIFFWEDEERIAKNRRKVYKELNIEEDRKIFLFAPTHRDGEDDDNVFKGLDYKAIKKALEARFGGKWQIVLRLHNRLKGQSSKWLKNLPYYVTDATKYADMQEILAVTEVGVTDYSSWIFDYVLTKKPGFIVERGLEDFQNTRGFYYPIETTPFPIAKDYKELCKRIREFDEEKYQKDITTFLEARGCFEDGHASERIVEKIKELLAK